MSSDNKPVLKTVSIPVRIDVFNLYEEADAKIKSLLGFSPGIPTLMGLSLAKETAKDVVDDFENCVRDSLRKPKKNEPTEKSA